MTRKLDKLKQVAAPPIKPSNLVSKLRRIRWELSTTMERTHQAPLRAEMAYLIQRTDTAIERMEATSRGGTE
ncbi:hypothetical protein H8A97_30420 [Bradyrhizobium sp. Arg62]|uniref:hypothetical protein n=1 Tax=Bradyrhizobium brasilense TaxID=1419277 RepID=UPI001E44DA46|nr:hypothetical protein [Bradyrhizobium brasilense]MCC8949301.1 hypothetical protein [Bradyrhizobium brasilense]